MNEEARKVRFYLRSCKLVPPRRVYCYAIESVSRYEPKANSPILRKKTAHPVWRAAAPANLTKEADWRNLHAGEDSVATALTCNG